jgi:hypothetical protein
MTRRHTASHALDALTTRWLTDEDLADLRLIWHWLLVCAGACLLGFLLTAVGPLLDRYDAWRAEMRAAHAQELAQESERAYVAWVQGECGPEAWWKPRADGALVCTDKRGRGTSRVLVEAQP